MTIKNTDGDWRQTMAASRFDVFEWHLIPDRILISNEHAQSLGFDPKAFAESGSVALLAQVHVEDRGPLQSWLTALRQGRETSMHAHFRLAQPSTNPRWLELQMAQVSGKNTATELLVGSLTDVSGYRDALARVAESEASLNGIIASAMDGIITIDESLKVVLFNRSAQNIFKCAATDVIGGSLDRFMPTPFRDRHNTHIRGFAAVGISQRRMGPSILPAIRSDGEEFPISATISQVRVGNRVLFTVIIRDVSVQVESEKSLLKSQRQLEDHSRRAHLALEDERRRIARELHDDLGQSLTAMKMELGMARNTIPPNSLVLLEHCTRMDAMIAAMVASTRRIAADLRPLVLDDLGLGAAIDWLVKRFAEQHRISANVYVDAQVTSLNEPHASAVFRIVQESLTNVARHSGATALEARIQLEEERIMINVWDNGRGLEAKSIEQHNTFGLRGMRERAQLLGGAFEVFSKPNEGTTVRVSLPRPGHFAIDVPDSEEAN